MNKKISLAVVLLISLFTKAQDNWDTLVRNGLNNYANFDFVKSFHGKLYVGGCKNYVDTTFGGYRMGNMERKPIKLHPTKHNTDRNGHQGVNAVSINNDTLRVFSSSDGLAFSEDVGFFNVVNNGTRISAVAANNNHMFIGTENGDYTWPQVYHLDGSTNTYAIHDTIHYDTTGHNSFAGVSDAAIGALAIFSPGGTNDSIYAFVNPGYSDSTGQVNNPSVYKSSISNPHWVNATKFDSISGIQYINDAIVWHHTLYASTEAYDASYNSTSTIISTTDGSHWDTIAKISPLLTPYGITSTSNDFNKFEIHNDTLMVSIYGYDLYMPVWYTTDSLNINPVWHPYMGTNPADSSILANNWGYVNHMKSFGNKLWLEFNYGGEITAAVYKYDHHNGLHVSSQNTYMDNYYSGSNDLYFETYNNKLYSAGTNDYFNLSQPSSPGGLFYDGSIGTLGMPVANFNDTSMYYNGGALCSGYSITFNNLSNNTSYYQWYVNDTLITSTYHDTTFSYSYTPSSIYLNGYDTTVLQNSSFDISFNSAGTYTVKLVAYGTSDTTSLVDSITKIITINQTPPYDIDSVYVVEVGHGFTYQNPDTICQGEPVTLMAVLPNASNYSYQWSIYENYQIEPNNIDTIYGNGTTVTTYTTATDGINHPGQAPYSVNSLTITDGTTGCMSYVSNFMPFDIYVNQSDSISGLIKAPDGSLATKGQVYLFKQKLNHVGVADSTGSYTLLSFPAGYFAFANAYYGDYYIQASLDTFMYPTSINTYYTNPVKPDAFQWDSATVIQHHGCSGGNDTLSIKVEQIIPVSGPGMISGTVVKDSTFGMRLGNGHNSIMGAPLKGVGVSLGKTPGGGCAARTTTNDTGYYSFSNVGVGTYRIYVDIPNYGMDTVRVVTIDSVNSNSTNNNYHVDSTRIYIVDDGTSGIFTSSQANSTDVKVYPNPAGNVAYVDFYNNQENLVMANLYDLNGNLISVIANEKMSKGTQSIRINLADMQLNAGVYIIKANINNSMQNFKLTVIQN